MSFSDNTRLRQPESITMTSCKWYLLAVLIILYRVHSTAGLGLQGEVKLGVLAEPTGIAEEGVLLVIVDGPAGKPW